MTRAPCYSCKREAQRGEGGSLRLHGHRVSEQGFEPSSACVASLESRVTALWPAGRGCRTVAHASPPESGRGLCYSSSPGHLGCRPPQLVLLENSMLSHPSSSAPMAPSRPLWMLVLGVGVAPPAPGRGLVSAARAKLEPKSLPPPLPLPVVPKPPSSFGAI